MTPSLYRLLADLVLLVHLGVVAFVVGGLVAIVAGNLAGRRGVNAPGFRALHLAAIGFVAAQAWLGQVCPLTTLESWLRLRAGLSGYGGGFVAHWVSRALYWDAPAWVFVAAYSAFAVAVVAAWWRWPPCPRRRPGRPMAEPTVRWPT